MRAPSFEARTQAARIKKQAREAGTRAGKVQYKEIVSRAKKKHVPSRRMRKTRLNLAAKRP